jgi:GNAT superfamily N-acetyltransferase
MPGQIRRMGVGGSIGPMIVEQPTRMGTPRELDRLSEILAQAFANDPVFAWLLPDESKRHAQLLRFFRLEVERRALPLGRIWTGDRADGVLLELASDHWQLSPRDQSLRTPVFLRIFGRRLPQATALISAMERMHPTEPHYYVPHVGVAPHAQGQGLGTALVGRTVARCDKEGFPAYLEATSERSAALYARLGFQHLRQFSVGNSPPIWPMRRPPA